LALTLSSIPASSQNLKSKTADDKAIHKKKSEAAEKVRGEKGADMKNDSIYEFSAKALGGEDIDFKKYEGKVLLIVNTASQCGYTPQYAELEKLHEKYADKGLAILGFPCNQFGKQEPGDDHEIAKFCQANYGVKFQMFSKIDVNGSKEHPIYKFLKEKAPGVLGSEAIKWNFTKFLVGKDGKVIKRYAPQVKPIEISTDIDKELSQN
ncbi:MAG TPA: glutathione peroxidase, partial [Nitrososphaera sp.]|nr:glutathione peroxidase [Nitrososphaera sp.]